jgi:hypothetical protein
MMATAKGKLPKLDKSLGHKHDPGRAPTARHLSSLAFRKTIGRKTATFCLVLSFLDFIPINQSQGPKSSSGSAKKSRGKPVISAKVLHGRNLKMPNCKPQTEPRGLLK